MESTAKTPEPPQKKKDALEVLLPGDSDFSASPDDIARLREHLLSSQQMQHILLLVGSGASLAAGAPSMWGLWKMIVGEVPNPEAEAVIKLVGDAKQNIEDLLSRCDAWLQINGSSNNIVAEFRDSAIKQILNACRPAGSDGATLQTHEQLLRKLCRRRARDQRLKLFTTNYDLCFEHAASRLGLSLLDGFSFTTPRRFDARFMEVDIVQRTPEQAEPGQFIPGALLYYKLHGSVNWSQTNNETFVSDPADARSACIIYPAHTKYHLSYTTPYFDMMSRYLTALRQPNTCLIAIGFGFSDEHLTNPIRTAIRTNPSFRLVAVSPSANSPTAPPAWAEFRGDAQQGRDVTLVSSTMAEFVPNIPELRALSPAEDLVRALKEVL